MSQYRLAKVNTQQPIKVLWNGEHRQFYMWNASVIKELRNEGLESCIRPNFVIPIVPHAAIEAVDNGRATVIQNTIVYQYNMKTEQNDVKCQKALGIITSSLGEDMEQRFDHIISDNNLSSRDKVFNLYENIVHAYSRDTIHLVTIVENEMQNLSPVSTYEGAIGLLYEINKRNNELNCMPKSRVPGAPIDAPIETNRLSDDALKKLLVRKLGASSSFNGLMDNLGNHPEWSWSKVQEFIRDTHMRISSSDSVVSKMEKLEIQTGAESSTAVMAISDSHNSKMSARRPYSKHCWNCKADGHSTDDCLALFCRNCSSFWSSNKEKGYHQPAKCAKRPQNTNGKRKNDQDRPDKKKISSVTFAKAEPSNVSLWDQVCFDEATLVVDVDEAVEDILNSVHDVYLSVLSTNYLIYGIATIATQQTLIESSILMLDSGAAISITHPEVARQYGVPIVALSQPTVLHFANNSTAEAKYMANFGPVLGKVLLCPEVSCTLISIVQLSRRYIKVCFEYGLVLIKDMYDNVMIEEQLDYDVGLPYVSISTFMNLNYREFKFTIYPQPQYIGVISAKTLSNRFKESPVTKEQYLNVIRFHERMGHLNPAILSKALRNNAWVSCPEISPSLIDRVFRSYNCIACALAKRNNQARQLGNQIPYMIIGSCLSADWVPSTGDPAIGGFIGYFIFVDLATGFVSVMLDRTKKNFLNHLKNIISFYKSYNHVVRVIRFDAGSVENAEQTITWIQNNNMIVQPAAVEAQYQNPAERYVQYLDNGVAALLEGAKHLDYTFWGLALLAFVFISNYAPNTLTNDYSPWYHLTGVHPDVSVCRFSFGQLVSVGKIASDKKRKFDARNAKAYAVGSSHSRNGSTLVYYPSKLGHRKVFPRVNVDAIVVPEQYLEEQSSHANPGNLMSTQDITVIAIDENDGINISDLSDSLPSDRARLGNHVDNLSENYIIVDTAIPPHILGDADPIPVRRYPLRNRGPTMCNGFRVCAVNHKDSLVCPTITQALSASEEQIKLWREALTVELQTLRKLDTHEVVDRKDIPHNAFIFPTKFVLRQKLTTKGEYIKHKARLTVLGNLDKDLASSELFSPTASDKSLKLVCAIAVVLGLILFGLDVYGAFLIPPIKRDVYVTLPVQVTNGKPVYWKLKKTLYGLADSPRQFYIHISETLMRNGYIKTVADPCVFIKRQSDTKFIIVVVYVDDLMLAATDQDIIDELRAQLQVEYTLTEAPSLESFIGINIQYNPNGSMTLSQPGFIGQLLEEYGMLDSIVAKTPMSYLFNDENQDAAERLSVSDHKKFMSVLGSLIFLLRTRADIAYAINRLSLRSTKATQLDLQALFRVLRYLNGTRNLGITLCQDVTIAKVVQLHAYVDAAYGIHNDGKSHSGYCFALGPHHNGMFYARSFKQTNVALSSTEAEVNPLVDVSKEIIWFRQLLKELGFPQLDPTPVFEDNSSAITLATKWSGNNKRTKHFGIRIHFLLEQYNASVIDIVHLSTDLQIADILTKPLSTDQFLRLRDLLLGSHLQ